MSTALEKPDPVRAELATVEPQASVTLFRTDQPDEVVSRAAATAKSLAAVVKQQKLTVAIQGRDHVRVEGWTLLGTMLGVFPICTWTRKVDDGWEARVEARTLAGQLVGAAEAQCLRSERTWSSRDDYALRSMAQTRATSKALRQPLGFVMTLAGFDATPFEEMPPVIEHAAQQAPAPPPAQASAFAPPPGAVNGDKATEAQQKMIDRLVNKITKAGAADAVQLAERLQAKYGTSVASELSKSQASEVITGLRTLAGEEDA